jgi:Cdc6-like AAA superfamily ATPase
MAQSTKEDWSALAYEATLLFSPSAPIDEAALFAGRQPQLRKLIEATLEKGKHAVLYGERGVGKTSLVKVFRLLFPSITNKMSLIREQCDVGDTFSSIWRKVFKDIRATVTIDGEERVITVADLYEGQITSDDVRRELAKAFASNEIPVIVIDEFDRTLPELRQEMASAIKDLSDDGVNVTVIMVGVADDIGDLFRGHQSIPRCIEQVPMPRMSNDEMKEIISKRLPRLGMKIVGDAMWKVVTLSRGLPSYVHLLGVNAVQSAIANRRLQITESDVDAAIKRAIDKSQESVRSSYATAVHTNRTDTLFKEVLLACALAKCDERGFFTPNAVIAPLTSIVNRTMEIANFQNHLKKFIGEDRGQILIRRGKERAYKFRFQDPMMQPFVIMKGVEEGLIQATGLDVLSSPEQPELPIVPKRPS